ncbi:MAG TPA: TA system VapC family ribonuclease toxin [Acidobacteriota bacterium]|jgi:toxin-antitoxin system PIN domain toxin
MRAVDTNVLVYAEITSSSQHAAALRHLKELTEGGLPWAIPWPCVYEFLRIVTHPRIFHPPVPMARALADLRRILASPSLVLLSETERHIDLAEKALKDSGAAGNLVHDAHIAALCLEHGVTELLTGDRDFTRFAGLRVLNPF